MPVPHAARPSSRRRRATLLLPLLTAGALLVPSAAASAAEDDPFGSDLPEVPVQVQADGEAAPEQAVEDEDAGAAVQAPAGEAGTAPAAREASTTAGAPPVGSAEHPAPAGARWVSPSGSDRAGGTAQAPWKTLRRAVAAAPAGATIVLRAGTYAETVSMPAGKRLTVQAAPGEEVWFDGSRVTRGWTAASGGDWRLDGWTARFDHSPTYTRGAPDNTAAGWSFVDADHPVAAYPEQVHVDGVAQQQVKTREAVVPGTFFADRAGDRLYLGTDPNGHEVRTSALETAITVQGRGSVLRGIGVRRYATSLPLMGTVRVLADDVVVEDVHVSDNATQGLFVRGKGVTLRRVTAERNGIMGISASYTDGLRAEGVRAHGNNTEHFNSAPAAGGVKIGRSRGVTVVDSSFQDNRGTGLWFDESVYDVVATGNDAIANTSNGISFEISSKAVFADNLVVRNGTTGMKINNAQHVELWNNTVADNAGRPVWLVQDPRVASNRSVPGHDPRRPMPDPTVTWVLGPITVKNNILAGGARSGCVLCVQDGALRRSAERIGVRADGNAYVRASRTAPSRLVVWPDGTSSPDVYASLSAFRKGEAQEGSGAEFTGTPVLDSSYRPVDALLAKAPTTARALDEDIAELIGGAAGARQLGATTLTELPAEPAAETSQEEPDED